MTASAQVWLLDASALIRIKHVVPGNQQWALFKKLEQLVESAELAFPRQIKVEVTEMAHPDAPGVWADGVFPAMRHPAEPNPSFVRLVMSSPAAKVVDPNKTREDGDPYLIALALQLMDAGHPVCVVTDDLKDNPTRIALSVACDHVSVPWCPLEDFLTDIKT